MLSIRFQCRTTGAELLYSSVPELRLDGGSMKVRDAGEVLSHREGWWRNAENRFLFASIATNAVVTFECGHTNSHVYGPFSQIDFVNGSIWVVPAHAELSIADYDHKQLLARYVELSDRWSDFEANEWSSVRIRSTQRTDLSNGEVSHATKKPLS